MRERGQGLAPLLGPGAGQQSAVIAPAPSSNPVVPGLRQPGLDAARVASMLLVVVLHAVVAYRFAPMWGLLWPVQESPKGAMWGLMEGWHVWWFDRIFWFVRALGVPIITVVAGYFAAKALADHGVRAFLRERVRRLLVPLVVGTATVLVVMYLIWAWGWVLRGWAAPEHILAVRFGPDVQPNLYGFAHLWYLQYLLLLCLGLAGVVALTRRLAPGWALDARRAGWLSKLPARLLWAGVPMVLVQWASPAVLLLFTNGFLPQPKLAWYAVLFAVGVMAYRAEAAPRDGNKRRPWLSPGLASLARWWWLELALALIALPFYIAFAQEWIQTKGQAPDASTTRWMLAISGTVVTLCGSCGLIGALLVLVRTPRPALSWLAGAGFWVYLMHLPFQGLACVLLYRQPIDAALKVLVGVVVGLGGPLALWPLVRGTRAAELLTGTRR